MKKSKRTEGTLSRVAPEGVQIFRSPLARVRRGGLLPRLGGWCLGRRSVSGITLWRTIWLAPEAPWTAELLLHELRHVQQFHEHASFPLRYIWESVRHGYRQNRYEVDARAYAARRVSAATRPTHSLEDV